MLSVIVTMGPTPTDLHGLSALLGSMDRHERPCDIQLILIDDTPSGRLRGIVHAVKNPDPVAETRLRARLHPRAS
jgi:hypothetical protein